jgi:peptidyl-prolyl cis-trans isomerase A (cyclophilin A)
MKRKHPFQTIGLLALLVVGLCFLPIASADDQDDDPPWAVLHTNMGAMVVQLFEKEAPKTVKHFIGLATGDTTWIHPKTKKKMTTPLYDGLSVHKIVPTYWVQMGCPLGNGKGSVGVTLKDEFHPKLRHKGKGIVSMANAGANRNGSQFFITLRSASWLDHKVLKDKYCSNFKLPIKCLNNTHCRRYKKMFPQSSTGPTQCKQRTISSGFNAFGKVVHGLDKLKKIGDLPVDVIGRPINKVIIKRIIIHRGARWKRNWLTIPKDDD